MNRYARAAPVLAVLMAACEVAPQPGTVGAPAPDYAARTLSGDSVALRDVEGKAVLVNLWATWCAPCRRETPELQALHEAYEDEGLRVIGITVDGPGSGTAIREFVEEFGVTYAVWWDPEDRATSAFGTFGLPTTYLLDGDGRVVWRRLGVLQLPDSAFITTLKDLLAD